MRNLYPRMARATLRLEGEAGSVTVAASFPSFVCENLVDGQPCGALVTPHPNRELPYCQRCKRPERVWRVALPSEIAAYDARFQQHVEQADL